MRRRMVVIGFGVVCLTASVIARQTTSSGDPEAAKIKNPVAATPESITAGKKTFQTLVRRLPRQGRERRASSSRSSRISGGNQPPDLTDEKWDHGSSDGEIFTIVKKGVPPDFFMAPWDGRVSDRRSGTWSTTSSHCRRRNEQARRSSWRSCSAPSSAGWRSSTG